MKLVLAWLPLAVLAISASGVRAEDKKADDGWIALFDGKTLTGWKASEAPENWKVEDGCIVGRGGRSHLFYMAKEFTDFEYKAEVAINEGGNSGMYFRTQFGPGWPMGYEAQVNNSHKDPKRTGSLYNFVSITDRLVQGDGFFTQHIVCRGNQITISVNGKQVVDYKDEKNTHAKGYIALQQHDPGSVVRYKSVLVKPLAPAKN